MTSEVDYIGTAIVYINMLILFTIIFLAVRLYLKYAHYINLKKKYLQKKSSNL